MRFKRYSINVICLCLFALVIFQCANCFRGLPKDKVYHLSDFESSGIILNDDKSFTTSDNDPQIVLKIDKTYVDGIVIDVNSDNQPWDLQVFYAADGGFSEENSTVMHISEDSSEISIPVCREIDQVRIDFGNDCEREFQLEAVQVNVSRKSYPDVLYFLFPAILIVVYYLSQRFNSRSFQTTKHIPEFDCIRALSAIIIVTYHYSGYIQQNSSSWSNTGLFFQYANGDWGGVAVGMFFILSGALLYHRHPELNKDNLFHFYISKAKAIYPSFWLLWLYFYINNSIIGRNCFYGGHPWTLILSVLGMDGYFSYRFDTYYSVGEWFLGAIIFCYIAYPVLLFLIKRVEIIVSVLLGVSVILIVYTDWFMILPQWNLLLCFFLIWIGMILMKHRKMIYQNTILTVVALIISIVTYSVKIGVLNSIIWNELLAISLFILLWNIANAVMRNKFIEKPISWIASISYQVFLVHHVVIVVFCNGWLGYQTNMLQSFLFWVYCTGCILIFAMLLKLFTTKILGIVSKK